GPTTTTSSAPASRPGPPRPCRRGSTARDDRSTPLYCCAAETCGGKRVKQLVKRTTTHPAGLADMSADLSAHHGATSCLTWMFVPPSQTRAHGRRRGRLADLITRRSRVQIPPPPPVAQVRGPFRFAGEGLFAQVANPKVTAARNGWSAMVSMASWLTCCHHDVITSIMWAIDRWAAWPGTRAR